MSYAGNVYAETLDVAAERDKGLVRTNQGGEAYKLDLWSQLRRFLILGTESATLYVSAKTLTELNIKAVKNCLDEDGIRTINEIVDVSKRSLAPSNEPALVALSMAASYQDKQRPQYAAKVRGYALETALREIARTGTHLLHFADYADKQRGWGKTLRSGIGGWFLSQSPMDLAYQVSKYQQRDGWSMADLLRKTHPKASDIEMNAIFKYIVDGEVHYDDEFASLAYLQAVEKAKTAEKRELIQLIGDHNLPREVIPTQYLNFPDVWDALLHAGKGMPMMAMLRNLATMSKVGLLTQGSDASSFVVNRLYDENAIKKSRLHPIDLLKAKLIYQRGMGVRSDASWNPVRPVVDAAEAGFYLSFGNVTPTNKRGLLALDCSGSMSSGTVAGVVGFTPAMATAAMSMISARVERDTEILGFTDKLVDLNISKHDSLNAAMRKVHLHNWGGTDCRRPMKYAIDNNKNFDFFAIYTDSDTGARNPSVTLREYRKKSGIHDAKLIVVAMVANQFSIADPSDRNMLDVVGFDASTPQVMSAFIRGEL